MGTIRIPGGLSGRTYELNIRGDTPSATETARAQAFVQQSEQDFAQQYQQQFGEELQFPSGNAFSRGWDVGRTSAYGALGTTLRDVGRGTGIDFLGNMGERMEGAARMEQIAEAGRMPAPTRFADVEGVGDFLTFVGEGAGQTGPEMLATLGATAAGGLAGPGGAVAAGTATALPFFYGRNIQRQEGEVATGGLEEVDRMNAFLAAGGQSILNVLGERILLTGRALGLSVPRSQNLFLRTGQFAAAGAAVEAPTEIMQQILERAQAGMPLDSEDAIAEYIEAGVLGGVIGGGVGGATGPFRGTTDRDVEDETSAGPSVPPTGTPPNLPPATDPEAEFDDTEAATSRGPAAVGDVAPLPQTVTAAEPGLTADDLAAIDADMENLTPVEQTRALLQQLGVPSRAQMYNYLAKLGVGPDDPRVAKELATYLPVYEARDGLMRVDPEFPDRVRQYLSALPPVAPEAPRSRGPRGPSQGPVQGQLATPAPPVASDLAAPPPQEIPIEDVEPEQDVAAPPTEEEAFELAAQEAAALEPAPNPETPSLGLRPIEWARKRFNEATKSAVSETGTSPIIDFAGRKIAVRTVNGVQVPFYLSSGRAGKVDVPAGKWYPILGVDPETGWLNKGASADIVNYYGNDALRRAAQELDATIGDIRNDTSVPSVGPTGPHIDIINEGLSPTANQQPDTMEKFNANLQNLLSRINQQKSADQRAAQAPVVEQEPTPEDAPAAPIEDIPFEDVPSDPRLVGVDPFGDVGLAVAPSAPAPASKPRPPGAAPVRVQRGQADIVQGQVIPEGGVTPLPAEAEQVETAATEDAPSRFADNFSAEEYADTARMLRDSWERRISDEPSRADILEFAAPADSLADPSTPADRRTVAGLFIKTKLSALERSARTVFEKYPTVVEALDAIAELTSRDRNLTALISNKELDKETPVNPETGPLDYAEALGFYERGIVSNTGANAAKWVRANLSSAADMYLTRRRAHYAEAEAEIRKRTSKHDPVEIARKQAESQVREFEQGLIDDRRERATAEPSGVAKATIEAAESVAEEGRRPVNLEIPAEIAVSEKEFADARAGLRRLPKSTMRGWTGLEIAVAQQFDGITTRKQAQAKIAELTDVDLERLYADRAVEREFLGLSRRFKTVRQAADLDRPISNAVRHALMNGDIKAALGAVAITARDAELRAFARAALANIGNTRVELVDPADTENTLGVGDAGSYDPINDIIYLPNTGDITVGTMLHEVAHAVTAAYVDNNPNSAEVGDIKALFAETYEQVMPYLGSVPYRPDGEIPTAADVTPLEVKEFAAEIKANMRLRETLRALDVQGLNIPRKGAIRSALNWLNSVFRRMFKRMGQRQPIPTALQRADFLIDAIMTPERAAGDVLFSKGERAGTGVSSMMRVVDPIRQKALPQNWRQSFGDDASNFANNAGVGAGRVLMGFLPPLAVGDIASKVGIPTPYRMLELVQRRDAMFSRSAQTVDAMLNRLQAYYKGNPEEKKEYDRIVTDASVEGADPSINPTVPARQDPNYTKWWLAFDRLDNDGNIVDTQRRHFDSKVQRDAAISSLNSTLPKTRTRARAAGEPRTSEELAIIQELKDRHVAMSPEGQRMFRELRDFYRARYDALWEVLQGNLDQIFAADPRTAAEAKQSVYAKLFDKGQITPYFPLVREGDYWVEFMVYNEATESTEPVKMSFETAGARDRMAKLLETEPDVLKGSDGQPLIQTYITSSMSAPNFRTDALFVRDIAKIFDAYNAKVDADKRISDDVMNDIATLMVKAAPEGSMARQFHKRNNTPGYIEDAEVALHSKGYRLANATARQVSSLAIRRYAQELRELKPTSRGQEIVRDELVKFGEGALEPMDSPIEQAAQLANRMAYGYTLLGNVSSFLVNLSSLANVIFPQLGGRYGFNRATNELTRASRLFMSSGRTRVVRRDGVDTELSALPSIDNYFIMDDLGRMTVRPDPKMSPEKRRRLENMAPLVSLMAERGMLHHSLFYDSLGLQDFAEGRSLSDKAFAFFGAPFHVVERMNRQTSATAAYELELAKLRRENDPENPTPDSELQKAAANEAIYQATQMNGGTSLNTAPRFTQRGLMRVAMMYKSYGITVSTLLFKTARQIVNNAYGSNPEMKAERDIAMRQMMGHLGTTFLLAGAHGLPLFGLATMIGNLLRDEDEIRFDEAVRLHTSEMFYKGPLNALTGFEISERVGLSELLYRANRYNQDPSAEESIVQLLGGPAWSTVSGIMRGLGDISEGEYWRGAESMLPLAVSNFMRAGRFYVEGGAQTRSDNFIYEDMTASEILGRAVGFNSAELVRRQDRSSEMVRIGRAVQDSRTQLIERYFLAIRSGDDEAAQATLDEILEFNSTVGERYPEATISGRDIRGSFDRRVETIEGMVNGVSINPQVRDVLARQYGAIQDGLTRY